ncbi:hypothetical protein PO124_10430 [Bacillus licheniformis]|nr:hypothetical protein [Bacillus licheniformis]
MTVYTVCRALLSITMQIPLVKWTEGLNIKRSFPYHTYATLWQRLVSLFFIDLWLLSTAVYLRRQKACF